MVTGQLQLFLRNCLPDVGALEIKSNKQRAHVCQLRPLVSRSVKVNIVLKY